MSSPSLPAQVNKKPSATIAVAAAAATAAVAAAAADAMSNPIYDLMSVVEMDNGEETKWPFLRVDYDLLDAPTGDYAYDRQEQQDDSGFRADSSAFTLTHLNSELLATIGEPVAQTGAFREGWRILFPAACDTDQPIEKRHQNPDRRFNGVVYKLAKTATKDKPVFVLDFYRSGTKRQASTRVVSKLPERSFREHFAFLVNDPAMIETIRMSQNRREVKFYLNAVAFVKVQMPYVPASVYTTMMRERSAAEKQKKKDNKASVIDTDGKTKSVSTNDQLLKSPLSFLKKRNEPLTPDGTPPSSPKKAPKKQRLAAVSPTSPKNLLQALLTTPPVLSSSAVALQQQTLSKTVNANRKRVVSNGADLSKKRRRVNVEVGRSDGKFTDNSIDLTSSRFLEHMSEMARDESRRPGNPFRGLRTWEEFCENPQARYAFQAVYSFFYYQLPHVIGIERPIEMPGNLPAIDSSDLK